MVVILYAQNESWFICQPIEWEHDTFPPSPTTELTGTNGWSPLGRPVSKTMTLDMVKIIGLVALQPKGLSPTIDE